MKKAWILLGLAVASTGVLAAEEKKIYKYTDENGVTHYSETKPNDNYKEADLPKLSIIPSAPVTTSTATDSTSSDEVIDPAEVADFEIIEPVNEQNLWGTGGKLKVSVGPLNEQQQLRYQVQFVLDGKKQKPNDATTQEFSGIYRGEHKVQALLVDRLSNKVMKKSKTITFFMHQNSKK